MKKMFRFGLVALALSLCVGTGVLALKAQRVVNKAEANAVNNVEFVFAAEDSTVSDTLYYSQSGSDLTYLPWTTLNKDNPHNFTFSNPSNSSYTVSESSSNKNYNYCYRPFFVYPRVVGEDFMAAKSRYTISVTFTLSLTKTASDGAAYAHAELFTLGKFDGTSNHLTPSLNNNRFETLQDGHSINYSTGYNNATTSTNSVGCFTKNKNEAVSVSTTSQVITFDNGANSPQVSRYQLGLFLGCNFGSTYSHQASATITYNITQVNIETIAAKIGNTCYTSLDSAITNATSGQTINVISPCTLGIDLNSTQYRKNLTLNLNGNTISTTDYSKGLAVPSGYTWTIDGGGGTIQNTTMANNGTQVLLSVSGTLTLSNVTINKSNGPSPTVSVTGTMTADSDVSIVSNSNYNDGYALQVLGGTVTLNGSHVSQTNTITAVFVASSGTLKSNGATISASHFLAIEMQYSYLPNQNKVYLYGNTTLSSGSGTSSYNGAHIFMDSAGKGNIIYANNGGSTYLTKAVTVYISGYNYDDDAIVVSGDNGSKVSILSPAGTGHIYKRTNNNIIYAKTTHSVSFNRNGGTGSMSSATVSYGTAYQLPNCTFTAPAYRSFRYWNTQADGLGTSKAPGSSYTVTTNVTFYAIWWQTEMDYYDEFRIEYLHMNNYDSGLTGQGDGSCSTYYPLAKDYFFNTLTKSYRNYFALHYTDEMARLCAWANANGEEIVFQTDDYVVNSLSNSGTLNIIQNNPTGLIIVMVSILAISAACTTVLFIRKRKHR